MNDRINPRTTAHSLKKILRTDDVGGQGQCRRGETRSRIALCGEVKHVIWLGLLHNVGQRSIVVEVTIQKKDSVLAVGTLHEMLDVIRWTAPTAHAINIPIRICQKKVGKV